MLQLPFDPMLSAAVHQSQTVVCHGPSLSFMYSDSSTAVADAPVSTSKKKSRVSFYNDNVKLKVKEKSVLIEKVGWIKIKEQIPIDSKYTNPRIIYDNKYWYLTVGIEVTEKNISLTEETIGIDLGIINLATCSNGEIYQNINKTKRVKKIEKKLKRLQRKLSKKYLLNKKENKFLETKNIIKLKKRIKLIHRKLANIRNNHLHQTTTSIVKNKPCKIVLEDLNVKGMMKNRHLSKAIANQCFHEFRRQLEYKCKLNNIELAFANRFFPSSKTCSSCYEIKRDLKLKDRIFKCSCGFVIDRDLNASINLKNYCC